MITQKTLNRLRRCVRVLGFLGFFPFQWDKGDKSFKVTKSSVQRYFWIFNTLALGSYSIAMGYVTVLWVTSTKIGPEHVGTIIFFGLFVYAPGYATVIHHTFWRKGGRMAWYFTQLVTVNSKWTEFVHQLGDGDMAPKSKTLERLVIYFAALGTTAPVGMTLIFVEKPNVPFQMSFLVSPEMKSKHPWIKIGMMSFETWLKCQFIWIWMFLLFYMLTHMLTCSYWCKVALRHQPSRTVSTFKTLQLMSAYYNDSVGTSILPIFLACIAFFNILGNFAIVRLPGKVTRSQYTIFVRIGINCTVFATIALLSAAKVRHFSEDFLDILRRPKTALSPVTKKQIRALRPFGIRLGILRSVRYMSVFMYHMLVVNYTISLLVMTSEGHLGRSRK